jgi:hypothetical protein
MEAGQTITSKLGGSETNIAYGDPVHWAGDRRARARAAFHDVRRDDRGHELAEERACVSSSTGLFALAVILCATVAAAISWA